MAHKLCTAGGERPHRSVGRVQVVLLHVPAHPRECGGHLGMALRQIDRATVSIGKSAGATQQHQALSGSRSLHDVQRVTCLHPDVALDDASRLAAGEHVLQKRMIKRSSLHIHSVYYHM